MSQFFANLVLLLVGMGFGILLTGVVLSSTPIFFVGFGMTIVGCILSMFADSNI